MDMTNQDYGKLVNQYSQSSPLGKNMVWAFLVGGAICTAGQGLSNLYQNWGMDQDAAGGRRLHHPDPGGGAADRAWVV